MFDAIEREILAKHGLTRGGPKPVVVALSDGPEDVGDGDRRKVVAARPQKTTANKAKKA
jgi:hypothetical protein